MGGRGEEWEGALFTSRYKSFLRPNPDHLPPPGYDDMFS